MATTASQKFPSGLVMASVSAIRWLVAGFRRPATGTRLPNLCEQDEYTPTYGFLGSCARPLRAIFAALLLIPLLSGCLLISGEQTINGPLAGTGHLSTTFVSAEGGEERTVTVSDANADLHAIVLITLDTGDLQIDLLQPDGALAFAVSNQPSIKVIRSGAVRSDANGAVRYRVSARSARHGEYQIFFLP